MCGIAGIFNSRALSSKENIQKMLNSISHRGPDDISAFLDKNCAIGSVRLEIFNFQDGKQPFISRDKNTIIVFNGEIFNYESLIKQVYAKDKNIIINSEIELIYYLFLIFKEDFVKKINGQFAICIKHRNRVYLYRDYFGIRPLFYNINNKKELLFCSEIKGISAILKNLEIDYSSLKLIIKYWTLIGERTIFKNIFQVEQGSYIIFDGNNLIKKKYSDNIFEEQKIIKYKNIHDAEEDFIFQLNQSVKRQMSGDVDIASYLSGGIDSSAISALLKQENTNTKTFSINFNNTQYDESSYQKKMIDNLKLTNTSLTINEKDIADNFQKVVFHSETPLFRTAPVPLFLLSQTVSSQSLKVVMTGEGADEILYGYDIFRENKIRNFIKKNPNSNIRWSLLKKLYAYLPQFQNPRYFNLLKEFYHSTIHKTDSLYPFLPRIKNNMGIFNFFNHDLINEIDDDQILFSSLDSNFENLLDNQKIQDFETKTLLTNYLLSSQGDRMTMANGVEGRYPFLDIEFVKYANNLPDNLKLNNLKDKFILRKSFQNILPREISNRPKIAYQAPEIKSFFYDNHDYVNDYLSDSELKKNPIYNLKTISNTISKIKKSPQGDRMGFRENSGMTIILSLQILLNEFNKNSQQLGHDRQIRIIN